MEQMVTSSAAQVIVSLIPIVGIVFGSVLLFFVILWHHNEVKLQIRTGTFVPRAFNLKATSLLSGLLLTGVGIILSLSFAIIDGFSYTILGGLVPFVIGLSLLIFYKVNPEFHSENK